VGIFDSLNTLKTQSHETTTQLTSYIHTTLLKPRIYEKLPNHYFYVNYFFDALGKRQAAQDISDLAIGIYFEISRYSNGTFSTKKLFKNK
jgi:hypothetical protein